MEAVVVLAPPDVAADEERLLSKITADAMKAWLIYERGLPPGEASARAARVRAAWEDYLQLDTQLRLMTAAGGDKSGAYALYAGEMRRAYAEWRALLIEEIDLQMREGDQAFRQGEDAYLSAQAWITGAVALAVALSALAGFFIVTSVSRPIRRLTALMARLAGNDLSVAVADAERRDEVGAMARAVSVFKESMVERQRLAAELERQARLEPLTGALNRRAFDELLRRDVARAQRHGRPLAVVLIDIDHFKRVNDTMGHAVGDRFLVAIAKTIAAALRAEDLFCRYGGEEFIVVLPETDGTGAVQAAERLRGAIEALRLEHEGVPRGVTASFGVASFADPARDTIENVIHATDLALYRAKATGRNRVVSYDATQSPKAAAG
jgi:diguanylate cyclase (GGDEF)-like protein